jgi:hypothetical protein
MSLIASYPITLSNKRKMRIKPFIIYYLEDQVKTNEVGRTCGTHGRGEKSAQGFGGKA